MKKLIENKNASSKENSEHLEVNKAEVFEAIYDFEKKKFYHSNNFPDVENFEGDSNEESDKESLEYNFENDSYDDSLETEIKNKIVNFEEYEKILNPNFEENKNENLLIEKPPKIEKNNENSFPSLKDSLSSKLNSLVFDFLDNEEKKTFLSHKENHLIDENCQFVDDKFHFFNSVHSVLVPDFDPQSSLSFLDPKEIYYSRNIFEKNSQGNLQKNKNK